MTQNLIESLGRKIDNYFHAEQRHDQAAMNKWEEEADDLVKEHCPSGSGIDSGTKIVWEKTKKNKIVLQADFHHMDGNGFYAGWTEHQIVITPTWNGFDLKITGRDRNQIKEYLGDLFHDVLNREV